MHRLAIRHELRGADHWFVVQRVSGGFRSAVPVVLADPMSRRLGETEFMQHCSIGLGVLDEILSVEELPEFVKTERTGPRSVKTVAKP